MIVLSKPSALSSPCPLSHNNAHLQHKRSYVRSRLPLIVDFIFVHKGLNLYVQAVSDYVWSKQNRQNQVQNDRREYVSSTRVIRRVHSATVTRITNGPRVRRSRRSLRAYTTFLFLISSFLHFAVVSIIQIISCISMK